MPLPPSIAPGMPELETFKGSLQSAHGSALSQRATTPKIRVIEALYPRNCCCQGSQLSKPCRAAQRGDSPYMPYAPGTGTQVGGRGILFYMSLGKNELAFNQAWGAVNTIVQLLLWLCHQQKSQVFSYQVTDLWLSQYIAYVHHYFKLQSFYSQAFYVML